MNMSIRITRLFTLLPLALLAPGLWAQASSLVPPRTLALLVGIADYALPADGEALGPLKGPENDVARAARLLVDRFGFDPAGIVILKGKEATHEAIVTTFHRHLIAQAGPATRVVFWFSGHGSRIPDVSGHDSAPRARDDGAFDDTLIAWNSREGVAAGSHDLADDELFSLLSELRSRDVVVVTDCCHSGGVLRGQRQPGVREVDAGTVPLNRERVLKFWPKGVELADDQKEADLPSVVHLAACSALEEAGEIETPSGTYGTLTWFLAQVLGEVDSGASWEQVGAMVRARVAGRGTRPAQVVAVTGAVNRAVFGGIGRPVAPGFQVDPIGGPASKRLLIGGGMLHGFGLSAEFDLVDLDGKKLGTAKVTTVSAATSNAEWQGTDVPPAVAMRARPTAFGTQQAQIRLLCGAGVDPALVAGLDIAQAVTDPAHADFAVARNGETLHLRDPSGAFVRDLGKDAADVHTGLRREHFFRSLWNGIAETGRFGLRVTVEPATEADSQRLGKPLALVRRTGDAGSAAALVGANVLDSKREASGGLLRLRVRNTSDADLHLAIVSVTELREVNVVYGKDDQNLLAAGKEYTKCVWVGTDPGWKHDRPMIDRYVIVATDRFADFKPFEQPAERVRTRGGEEGAGLPPFLREAIGGARTRGDEATARAWGITFCDLQLMSSHCFGVTMAQQELAAGRHQAAVPHLLAAAAAAGSDGEKKLVADLLERANQGLLAAAKRAQDGLQPLRPAPPGGR
ncbi:MAG: caspase family protein [Planctomycetota bacterium]